jgi:hypothetical protein
MLDGNPDALFLRPFVLISTSLLQPFPNLIILTLLQYLLSATLCGCGEAVMIREE